jgi:TolB-like protein
MGRRLQLNVLGRFEIRSKSEPVDLRAKKAQALLAFLTVENGRHHSRGSLATLLWGGTGEERARHNLRQALSQIRRTCGSIVVSEGQSLRIANEKCTIDVVEFERLAKETDANALAESLDHSRGDLLDGVQLREPEFEDWLRDARERLRGIACATIDRLTDTLIAEDKEDEAIKVLGRRLAMDSACEPAHRTLMDLLARKGRRSDALRQYRTCVDALKRELGAEPSPETRAAYETILKAGGSGAAPAQIDQSHPPVRPDDTGPVVAILPFDNLSSEDDLYFADGITEDIITALSCFHDLQVIARGSSFVYRDRDVPEHEIAAALGAQFLVRGSMRRAGSKVRINVQLLDGARGLTVWGHRYDGELVDVFQVQNEITSTLVSTLAGRVEDARLARARSAPSPFHARGLPDLHRPVRPGDQSRSELRGRPRLARLRSGASNGLSAGRACRACRSISSRCRAGVGARRERERMSPHPRTGLSDAGRPEEGEEWVRKAVRLNPYHPQRYWSHLARALFHQRRFDEALAVLDQIGRPRSVKALRVAWPHFDPKSFVDRLPYERAQDRELVLDPLAAAL